MKITEKATDWDRINAQCLKGRLKEQYEYDREHGIGAYKVKEKQECEELHEFFVKLEKENDNNARCPVIYI